MAKASKQGASRKTTATASSTGAARKKATKLKKPAAATKTTRAKTAAAPKRKAATVKRSTAPKVKKVARQAASAGAPRKVAANSSKVRSAKPKTKALVFPTSATPAVAASRTLTAAPAEFHSPATTIAQIRAAAAKASEAPETSKAPRATSSPKATKAPKTTSVSKSTKVPKQVQRRAGKATTLVVSPATIDTALAAEVAANMVLNHMVGGADARHLEREVSNIFTNASAAATKTPRAPKRETSLFKHMKETVANPTSHHLDGLFGVIDTKKQPRLPFNRYASLPAQSFDKDFGLDVRRTNLPRRKAG